MGSFGFADDVKTHAVSSLMAGTMATTICAPADVLKSRLQSSAGQNVSRFVCPPAEFYADVAKGPRRRPQTRRPRGRLKILNERVAASVAQIDVSLQKQPLIEMFITDLPKSSHYFNVCVHGAA